MKKKKKKKKKKSSFVLKIPTTKVNYLQYFATFSISLLVWLGFHLEKEKEFKKKNQNKIHVIIHEMQKQSLIKIISFFLDKYGENWLKFEGQS